MPLPTSRRAGRQAESRSMLTVLTLYMIVVCCLCCYGVFGASVPPAAESPVQTAGSRHPTDSVQRSPVSSKYDDLIARLDETYRALVGDESGTGDNRETRVFDRHGRVMTDGGSPSSSVSSPSSSTTAAASRDDDRLLQLANALSSSGGWLPAASEHDTLFGRSSLDAVIADLIQLLRDLLRARALDRGETQKSLKLMLDLVEVLWRDRDRM